MGDVRLRLLKLFCPLYRCTYIYKFPNRFCKIHSLPQKSISAELISDIKKCENLWRANKDPRTNYLLTNHLNRCFMRNDEILTSAIDMITYASNRGSSYDFIFSLVKTFDNYIQEHKIELHPTFSQKKDLLLSILQFKNYQLVQLVCNVFKMNAEAQAFNDIIELLVQQQKIVEAAFCISALHLQTEFDAEKIVVPLLLEGHTPAAIIYMTNHPEIQLKVASLVDKFLDKDFSAPYINSKRIFKRLTSIVNVFKIPLTHCPNVHFIRSKGAINILINRRIEQSVSEETWEDMIQTVVKDSVYLQRFLIKKLVKKKDLKTAATMAKKYNIDDPSLFVQSSEDDITENQTDLETDVKAEDLTLTCEVEQSESEDKSNNHLEFALNFEDIKIVDNKEDFLKSVAEISQKYTMIGMDSEWKPHFGLSRDRLALIQLAGHDKVYIFDVLMLMECLEAQHWDKLFDDIFGNPNIIKLGCGIVADINIILESIKGSVGKTIKFSHMLDIALFYQKLQDVYPDKLDQDGNSAVKSLSFICETILGKPLNKEERLCNWEIRPLKDSQLEYAALDAHCLLQIYDKLREDSMKENINFDHLAKVAIVLTNKQWKPKRKFKGVKSEKAFHIHSAVPIEHFRAMMDPIFKTQGRELRQFGADVIFLENIDIDSALKLSKSEGRVVICSDHLWNQVKDKVDEGFCHKFQSGSEDPITVSHFLQHFNVHVSAKSIFTRCRMCNSKDGIKLYLEDLEKFKEFEESHTVPLDLYINNNMSSFRSELQVFLKDILNSNIKIKFAPLSRISFNQFAFLCKTCGNIC